MSVCSVMFDCFATTWTVACQAPLSIGFSRQEYWIELPCPPPEDLPNPGIKPIPLKSRTDRWVLYHCTPGKHSWKNKYNHFPGLSSSTRVILSPIFCLNLTKKWGRVTCKSNDFIPPLKFSEDHMSMSVQTLSKMSVLSFLSRPDAHKAPVWVLGVCSLHLLW